MSHFRRGALGKDVQAKRLALIKQGLWLTANAKARIPIKELSDDHVKNIYNLWERRHPPFHTHFRDQLVQPIREEFHRRFPISGE